MTSNEKFKILVVEDNSVIRQFIAMKLKTAFDCHIIEFERAEPCLQVLNGLSPSLVIVDFHLDSTVGNAMNGLQFITEMRKRENHAPIIMASSQRNISKAVATLKNGAINYINKDDTGFLDRLEDAVSEVMHFSSLMHVKHSVKTNKKKHLQDLLIIVSIIFISITFIVFNAG